MNCMRKISKILTAVTYIIACFLIGGCNYDEPTPGNDSNPDSDKTCALAWDTIVCNQLSVNELFIGSKYLGVQNWNCNGNPPGIYPAAVFPEDAFATTFDKEVSGKKNPIVVYTNFSDPFISTIENPSGVNYSRFLKSMLRSEEYQSNSEPQLNLYRCAKMNTLDSFIKIFPDNPSFAETFESIVKQKMDLDKIKSWTIGEIIFKGFTVTMDVPEKGIFANEMPSENGLVYVRSITYGSTAYFVIGSDLTYPEVRAIISKPSMIGTEKQNLKNTHVVLLTNSGIDQNAELHTESDALYDYFRHPYIEGNYGYPIYRTGCYLKDNSYIHISVK